MSSRLLRFLTPFATADRNLCWPAPKTVKDPRSNNPKASLATARILWVLLRGPLADDTTLVHGKYCKGTTCQNPYHRLLKKGSAIKNLGKSVAGKIQANLDRANNLTAAMIELLNNWKELAPKLVPNRPNVINGVRFYYPEHADTPEDKFVGAINASPFLLENLP